MNKKNNQVQKAVKILNKGGIVIFPTDTAFGIGCRIDKPDTIMRLFKIMRRPESKPTSILVDSIEMAKKYTQVISNEVLEKLIKPYWPGALTIVLPAVKPLVPSLVRGGVNNIGIRVPDNDVMLEIIKRVGIPILGPSANFSGYPTPFTFEEIDKNIIKLVDYVIKGECKTCKVSTVVDCSVNPWKIVRKGAIKLN